MAFSGKIDALIREFCETIGGKYQLNPDKLFEIWSGAVEKPVTVIKEEEKVDPDLEITREKILASNKDGLTAMCKLAKLKISGKKEEIVQRLLDWLPNRDKVSKPVITKKNTDSPVIQSYKDRSTEFAIRKNAHGNFEHVQTKLVFNSDKLAYGKQADDGNITPLTSEDIETCKKYKFPFKIPENLNHSSHIDVNIDELDEEVLDDEDIDEEEEEEDEIPIEDE